nr:hypothetical protein CFP56_03130 [Quercus suber]
MPDVPQEDFTGSRPAVTSHQVDCHMPKALLLSTTIDKPIEMTTMSLNRRARPTANNRIRTLLSQLTCPVRDPSNLPVPLVRYPAGCVSEQTYISPVAALTGRNRLNPSYPGAPRYVTRYQSNLVRDSFMFLNLPFELRLMIYEYCVDVSGIQKILSRYYHVFKDANDAASMRTPIIFKLNRQIYIESSMLLTKRSLTFDHGLLDLAFLNDFIRAPVLRTLASITITDAGHDLFRGTKNPANSWYGYMELIEQLGRVFIPAGHRLKTFSLHFASAEFKQHVTVCWDASFVCGYRDTLKKALAILGRVRNVASVSLEGFPEPLAMNLRNMMQRSSLTFFCLPPKIRNKIYRYAADLSDVSAVLNRTLVASPAPGCFTFPALSTPTVLLLNRQITLEALSQVRRLAIEPSMSEMARLKESPSILNFITVGTLQRVQELYLSIQSWECIDILSSLLPILTRRHSLKKLYLSFKESHSVNFLATNFRYPDTFLQNYLLPLTKIRGLESVEFSNSGSLPLCYTHPLRQIMLSKPVAGETVHLRSASSTRERHDHSELCGSRPLISILLLSSRNISSSSRKALEALSSPRISYTVGPSSRFTPSELFLPITDRPMMKSAFFEVETGQRSTVGQLGDLERRARLRYAEDDHGSEAEDD